LYDPLNVLRVAVAETVTVGHIVALDKKACGANHFHVFFYIVL
jgi:hypothetical protein